MRETRLRGGNIKLAQSRAKQAKDDLDAALNKAIGREELKFRNADTIRRLMSKRFSGLAGTPVRRAFEATIKVSERVLGMKWR